jgi:uncharacterized repeat protein (TIGR03803 family)
MKVKCEINLANRITDSLLLSFLPAKFLADNSPSSWFDFPRRFPMFRSAVAVLLLLFAAHSGLGQSVTGIYSFTGRDDGANPEAGLLHAADGNLYGVAILGGTEDEGSFFRLTSSGATATVYSFCPESGSCPSGREPGYALTQGTDGSFYSVTRGGGSNSEGVVYKISPSGSYTTLYSFCAKANCEDGSTPEAALALGSDGNFYGTTLYGGTDNYGTVFKISPSGNLTTAYGFSGTAGYYPCGRLLQATDGNFYGTTFGGGANSLGTIFKLTSTGILTTLHSFDFTDGTTPCSGLIEAADGNLYGVTAQGGNNSDCTFYGCGVLFRISTSGSFTALYDFKASSDGAYPYGDLVVGSDSNLYGTANEAGKTTNCSAGCGTLFRATTAGALTPLYAFSGPTDGAYPNDALIQASDGNFYGTNYGYGNSEYCSGNGCGTLFSLTPSPVLAAPVQLTLSKSSVEAGTPVTLSWKVLNAFSLTAQQCSAFVQNSAAGAGSWTGQQAGTYSSSTKLFTGSASITPASAGTYTYSLTCGGVESGFATLTVSGTSKGTSTTTLTATPNPATVGQSVSLKATVTGSGATPAGRVTYDVTTIVLGSESLSSGVATLTASSNGQAPGIYPIVANYAGSSTYDASSSKAVNVTLNKAPTSTTLSASPTTVIPPGDATLTATVKRSTSGATGVPTGTVSFTVEGVTLDTVKVNGSGVATLKASSSGIAAGSYPIKAVYNGDASDVTSTSAAVTVTVK